jgi:hypothetical protein
MKKQSNKKYDRPDGLTYRLPGRRAKVLIPGSTYPEYGKIVRNIYAKPDLTRPTLCEVNLFNGMSVIIQSDRVEVCL